MLTEYRRGDHTPRDAMPHSWFYYIVPLAMGILFFFAGLTMFRRFARGYRDERGKEYGKSEGCGGVLFMALGALLALALLLTSPTPWTRRKIFEHVFHTPPDQIQRFILRPAEYESLTASEIVIDDPARIRQIAQVLQDGEEISINHPRTRWSVRVEMVTRDGTYYFGVSATVPGDVNGTMVAPWTSPHGGGWNLGDVRANGLEKIFEEAAHQAQSH